MEITNYEKTLCVAFWIVMYFFIKELIANPRADQYKNSIDEYETCYFVKPRLFVFLYKNTIKNEEYIGVLKDRYILCTLLFPLWCLGVGIQLMGFFIDPKWGLLYAFAWFLLMMFLTIVYVLPCELKLYKRR